MSYYWPEMFGDTTTAFCKFDIHFGLFFSGRQNCNNIIYTNKRLSFALRKNNIYASLYGRPLQGFRLTGSRVDGRIVILLLHGGSDLIGLPSISHFPQLSSNTLRVAVIYVGTYNLLHNDKILTIFSPLRQYNCII